MPRTDAKTIRDGGRDLKLYSTEDGSLDDGIEIHTHAMTFNAMSKMDWKPFNEIRKNGAKSYDTNTAGLHVHLSRDAFTLFHWLRFVEFFYSNMALTDVIMRRRNYNNLNHYATFSAGEIARLRRAVIRTKKERNGIKSLSLSGHKSRAFNYNHSKTFELRFFGGSLNERKFKSKIEFIQAVFELTRHGKPSAQRFKNHVTNAGRKFPHLNAEFKTPEFSKAFQFPKTVNKQINL